MPNEIERLYRGKDVDMLTALSTILLNANANQVELQKKRTNLTKAYLEDLKTRLDAIIQDNLGVDNAEQLRQQTAALNTIQKPAYNALSNMKKQIESSYSSDKTALKEWLTNLGYTSFFKKARNKDTEGLLSLLFQYQVNMTPDKQQTLADTGIPAEIITAPLEYAANLQDANVTQESLKGTRKEATAAVVQVYNDIYFEIISRISKLASVFFPGQKARQQLLSYTAILKAMNHNKSSEADNTPPAP